MHTGSLLLTKMQTYLSAFNLLKVPSDAPLFCNHAKPKFTPNGISYLLQKYADNARVKTPSLIPEKISPHMFRHSKAMRLVQAGVNIIYIRDFLGHTNIRATEIYARADGEMKRAALAKADKKKVVSAKQTWNNDPGLVAWLKDFGK